MYVYIYIYIYPYESNLCNYMHELSICIYIIRMLIYKFSCAYIYLCIRMFIFIDIHIYVCIRNCVGQIHISICMYAYVRI
jgi:hypothetical protein